MRPFAFGGLGDDIRLRSMKDTDSKARLYGYREICIEKESLSVAGSKVKRKPAHGGLLLSSRSGSLRRLRTT